MYIYIHFFFYMYICMYIYRLQTWGPKLLTHQHCTGERVREELSQKGAGYTQELAEAETAMQRIREFTKKIMSDHKYLTAQQICIFEVGQELGWSANAAETDLLASLAVEVASACNVDMTQEADWNTAKFATEEVLRIAFWVERDKKQALKHVSERLSDNKRKHDQIQKTMETKRVRSEGALKRASSMVERDEAEREHCLAARNAQNRSIRKITKARRVRPMDAVCDEKARRHVDIYKSSLMLLCFSYQICIQLYVCKCSTKSPNSSHRGGTNHKG